MDIFILFPLLKLKLDINYIESIPFKRCLQLIKNLGQNNEWESAKMWYSSKKNELARSQEKKGTIAVNQDKVLNDFMEKTADPMSEKLASMFGF